jgi:uncharacterized linocin/CFP29 family protein
MTNAIATFSRKLDEKLVNPLRQVLKGRQLVHVTPPQGFGVSSVDWGTIAEMSEGYVSFGFSDGNTDAINVSLTNSKVPVYWKQYSIDRRIYDGWMSRGIDIDASNAIAAGYQAAKAEDAALINGISFDGTNYDINGLYQGAGNDYATGAALATFGVATTALTGAIQLMDDDGVPVDRMPLNWCVNSTSYQKIRKSRDTVGTRELPDILDLLNGGQVISIGTTLTTAQGFVAPTAAVGEPYVDYYLTADFQTDPEMPKFQKTGNIGGRVFSAGVLRIKQSTAICKTSNLS